MKFRYLFVVAISAVLLSGCGGKSTASNTTTVEKKNSPDDQLSEMKQAAESNSADALNRLGVAYSNGKGEGIPKNDAKALELIQKAAAMGDAAAQHNLGEFYQFGLLGLPKDESKAFELMLKSAAQGNANAQRWMGRRYMHGDFGTKKDGVIAYAWFNLAAAQEIEHLEGDSSPSYMRDKYIDLSTTERTEAQQISTDWKKGDILKRLNK